MAISQKDIKLLWGHAGNRCAICQCELARDSRGGDGTFHIGEQAHIVGEKDGAARGESSMPMKDRNSYDNLILLCPNHHAEIDKCPNEWSVEKLYLVKSQHELWVRESLSSGDDLRVLAAQQVIASTLDSIVELLELRDWNDWVGGAMSPDGKLLNRYYGQAEECYEKVILAIWPEEYNELRGAVMHLVESVRTAIGQFCSQAELIGETWRTVRYYKQGGFNRSYHHDARRFQAWENSSDDAWTKATKAANWFADVVRRDINPLFFTQEGRFVMRHPRCTEKIPTYSKTEIHQLIGEIRQR